TPNTARNCPIAGPKTASDASAAPQIARLGMITRLAPTRSMSQPRAGAENAATSVSVLYADDAVSRDHENSSQSGLRNPGNVCKAVVAKTAPVPQAATARQPS